MSSSDVPTDLFGAPAGPAGLRYAPEVIPTPEADAAVAAFAELPFAPFEFHGFEGLRRVVSFGRRYDFAASRLKEAAELPPALQGLQHRAAAFAGLAPDSLVQTLVTEYRSGAPIGWHRDRPEFGKVIGLSFLSPAVLRFRRRRTAGGFDRHDQRLEPRSAYLLDGEARTVWEHSIAPAKALRYSVTFRTLRG